MMRASQMTEGQLYRTVGPVGELWPGDPEVIPVGQVPGQETSIADLLKSLGKSSKPSPGYTSGLRRVRRPI